MNTAIIVTIILSICNIVLVAIIIPLARWAGKKVIAFEIRIAEIVVEQKEKHEKIDENYARHQVWMEGVQRSVNRTDRNVAALCSKAGIKYEKSDD